MTTSVALFDCPHCIDEFAFDYQKIAKLTYGWRVRVRCPGCGNIVQVVMLAFTLIHGCDADKYKHGEILEILPPETNPSLEWRMAVNKLRMEILQKKTGWRPEPPAENHAVENHAGMKAPGHNCKCFANDHRDTGGTKSQINGVMIDRTICVVAGFVLLGFLLRGPDLRTTRSLRSAAD